LETKYVTFFNAKRADDSAVVFPSYLKMYHKGKSESDILLPVIVIKATMKVIKATMKWSKSKFPLIFDHNAKSLLKNSQTWHKPNVCSLVMSLLWMQLDGHGKKRCVVSRIANGTACKFWKLVLKCHRFTGENDQYAVVVLLGKSHDIAP
jgi:hypothetical protein